MPKHPYLVFSSVGDETTLAFPERSDRGYDVCIAFYGSGDCSLKRTADFFVAAQDFKIPNFLRTLELYPELLKYEFYFFIDDDLLIDPSTIEATFAMATKYQLALCQPSLSEASNGFWKQLFHKEHVLLEYTNFVEIQCFCLSRRFLAKALPFFYLAKSGMNLDFVFAELLKTNQRAIAVLHCLQYKHPQRRLGQTVRDKIFNFYADASNMDLRMRFCLGERTTGPSLFERFRFNVYRTVYNQKPHTFCGIYSAIGRFCKFLGRHVN